MADKNNVGNAGEFYLAAVLSANDCVVNLTLGRNTNYDLLIVNPRGEFKMLSVKTSMGHDSFPMNKKVETVIQENLYYGFVKVLQVTGEFDYWIVPSRLVASVVSSSHQNWLSTSGKNGRPHKNTDIRQFHVVQNKWLPEHWIDEIENYHKALCFIL